MSASLPIRLSCDTVRTVAFGGISPVYAGVGTAFTKPVRIFYIQNLTDTILMFSYDGINDHFPLFETTFKLLDVTANHSVSQGYFMAQGQRLYVRDMTAQGFNPPTTGSVWLTVYVGGM